jgi:acetyl esterase/lipase
VSGVEEVIAMTCRSRLGVTALLVVIAASCGGGDGSSSSSTTDIAPTTTGAPTTMAVPTADVTVIKDIPYGDEEALGWEPLLDVYAPTGASDLPLVVFFHGGGVVKDSLQYPELAEAIAARGAVVVNPTSGWQTGAPVAGIDAALAEAETFLGGAACAVSFAVAKAGEWGAASDGVTLAGHSGGADFASVLAFDPGREVSGCSVPATSWTPHAAMLWEGAIGLLDPQLWDSFGADLSQLFAVLTPWKMLDAGFTGPVQFVVSDWSRQNLTRCDDVNEWAPMRDPSGDYQSWLQSVGALDDGCVDIGDNALALGAAMTSEGVPNSFVPLSDASTVHATLSDDDLQRVAQIVYDLAVG